MKITALALDLDGTLLTPHEEVSPRNLAAVKAAMQAGLRVIVASARWRQLAARVAAEIGTDAPLVACSGAQVWRPADGLDIYDVRLPAAFARALYAICDSNRCVATLVDETPAPPPPPTPPPPPPPPTPPPPPQVSADDFKPAFFDYDSYALRDDSRAALDQNSKLLRDNASLQITIEGHCDERGTVEYNQALGEKRAQAARDYLTGAGTDASRIQIVSYGKERPFDSGHDEASWAKNRRAHFVLR